LVRKPSKDSVITSLEILDAAGEVIAMILVSVFWVNLSQQTGGACWSLVKMAKWRSLDK